MVYHNATYKLDDVIGVYLFNGCLSSSREFNYNVNLKQFFVIT